MKNDRYLPTRGVRGKRWLVQHIKNLRRKLEVEPAEPRDLLTVYGVGCKFTDEV